ncbi:MAG: AAA family ATPase [Solidesulfovibrio sp.]|uniref:AAA family ATPase n=1 Tax=Solidesulfovibrio sp. TaxID=2910990 RepID=UPI002B1EC67B|nr:AAA family ATPase [Solidesulfovibrio sp.]MEA4857749.1 AAA family ATPase [Solidesulfovibrio sp.]
MIDLNLARAQQTPTVAPEPAKTLDDPVAITAAVQAGLAQEGAAGQEEGQPQEEPRGFFASLDLAKFETGRFLDEEPPPPSWIFDNSFLAGTVGFVAGAQGTGKSRFLLQIGAAIATGHRGFLGDALRPARKGKVLAIFCEESRPVLWRRIRRMFRAFCPIRAESEDGKTVTLLPHPAETDFRTNFIAIPAAGQDLRLVEMAGGEARPSRNFHELLALAKSIPGLALTILDPQSRLYGQNENDNACATTFCSLLEHLAQETGAGVLCCAHVGKGVAKKRDGSFDVDAALHQDAMRGASGFSAAARWQLNLASLPGKAARARGVGSKAGDGQYLAGKVNKANDAPLGEVFYLHREHDGTLRYVEPEKTEEDKALEAQLVERITAEVRRREEANEPALTIKALGDVFPARWKEDIPGATKTAVRAAVSAALLDGHLFEVQRRGGNRKLNFYLSASPDTPLSTGQEEPSGDVGTGQRTGQELPDRTGQKGPSGAKMASLLDSGTGQKDTGQNTPSGPGTRMKSRTGHRTASLSKERENTCPVFPSSDSLDTEPEGGDAE